jgi:hypothetical protein
MQVGFQIPFNSQLRWSQKRPRCYRSYVASLSVATRAKAQQSLLSFGREVLSTIIFDSRAWFGAAGLLAIFANASAIPALCAVAIGLSPA